MILWQVFCHAINMQPQIKTIDENILPVEFVPNL